MLLTRNSARARDFLAQDGRHGQRIRGGRAHDKRRVGDRLDGAVGIDYRKWSIGDGQNRLVHAAVRAVAHHADHAIAAPSDERLSDRALTMEELSDEGLVDNCCAGSGLVRPKVSAVDQRNPHRLGPTGGDIEKVGEDRPGRRAVHRNEAVHGIVA